MMTRRYQASRTSRTDPCPLCLTGFAFHGECEAVALGWWLGGDYDCEPSCAGYWFENRSLYRLAPVCYLCGIAPTENVEHVIPQVLGGPDRWANVAGACIICNVRKGGRPFTPTPDQAARLAAHQAGFRAAYARVTEDMVWRIAQAWLDAESALSDTFCDCDESRCDDCLTERASLRAQFWADWSEGREPDVCARMQALLDSPTTTTTGETAR
ncbi:MAG TPA: HNH endonuclease [Sporichthyaceae bacterium]|jgi:hypothetical protein|nr:HNH endonuclease [Sporichthyaceae bacterium]